MTPFDLKRITKEFGDLITNKKCLAYYGFEIHKLESMSGQASGVSLNDMQKFVIFILQHQLIFLFEAFESESSIGAKSFNSR